MMLALLALTGCAHMDSPGEVTYSLDAKENYDLGQEALKSGRHLEAIKYFEHVRFKFPYSAQAALADLGIADTNFDREKYVEAIEGYRTFLKMHPSHGQADYAAFRIALAHYKDIPSDFILFPPSTQKDQSAVREARISMDDFIRQYPGSSYAAEAKGLAADIRRRLAAHVLYVADFYLHRKRWQAAAGRLNKLLNDFPGSGFDGEALLKLARSYLALDQKDQARSALQRLITEFPQDPARGEAERLLSGT
ncbi:MAG: outer membrane protein assembly factor BamD [Deltaproteobacteria bacterium]|nr:outer membrane protein assembly factor BamD [Deltaproteobacteria bacterium]